MSARDDLTTEQRQAMTGALARIAPATGEQVRQAVSDAWSVAGHHHQPLIQERLMRAEVQVPAIVRRLLDAEAEAARLRASAEGAHRRITEVLDYLATKDATQLSEDAGVMGFHIVAVLDGPAPTAAEAAERDVRHRAEVLREAARLLEATGRDDDAVSLLDNMAAAHEPGGTAYEAVTL